MTRRIVSADRVFDSISGVMRTGVSVVVEDERVTAVVDDAEVENAEGDRSRFPGATIVPGLIDCHTHLAGEVDTGQGYASLVMRSGAEDALVGVKHAGETLRAGFTTVRDVGSFRAFTDVALRDAIEAGWVKGPRMMCAGAYVTCPGGGGDITGLAVDVDHVVPRELRFGVTSGIEEMRSTVRQILRYRADFIKIIATGAVLTSGTNPGAPEFTEAEIRAAVEVAAEAGTFVAAHAHGTEGIKRAVRAGVRSIEHGSELDAECVELMAENGTFLVADLYDGDWISLMGPSMGYSEEALRKNDRLKDSQRAGFSMAAKVGVRTRLRDRLGCHPTRNQRPSVSALRPSWPRCFPSHPERHPLGCPAARLGRSSRFVDSGNPRRPGDRARRSPRRHHVARTAVGGHEKRSVDPRRRFDRRDATLPRSRDLASK